MIVNDWRLLSKVHEVSIHHPKMRAVHTPDITRLSVIIAAGRDRERSRERSSTHPIIQSSNPIVPRGRLWLSISAIGTSPSVCKPLISKPKIRVITASRALSISIDRSIGRSVGRHRREEVSTKRLRALSVGVKYTHVPNEFFV